MRTAYNKLLVLFIGLLFITACASNPASVSNDGSANTGLLWKIESPGVAPSFLFGTIHSEDPRVIDLPPAVAQSLKQSVLLALEIEFSPETGKYAFASMFFSDGRTLDKVAGKQLAQKAAELMSTRGLPEHQAMMMKPWAIFTLMNMPEPETGVYLDLKLHQLASSQGKKLYGLETIEEQIATFDEMPMAEQVALLEHSLANQDEMSEVMEKTIEIYLSKDLAAMEALNKRFMGEMPVDLATMFTHRLINFRNARMYERMKPLIASGGAFVAVGALHLPGESGLIKQLRQDGISVSVVY